MASIPRKRLLSLLMPGIIAAGVLWLLLPSAVVVMDDDFWYLRSVVQTLWKGRPWTDEWLTPWSASTTLLSSGLFLVTGSFRAGIHGNLMLAAGLSCTALTELLRTRQIPIRWIAGLAATIFLFPTVLFMELMFTSVALYWAALWVCVLFASQRKWGPFFLFWTLAAANRQSAVVWLAIPCWHFLEHWAAARFRIPRSREARSLALGIAWGPVFLVAMKLLMNPTLGQHAALGSLASSQSVEHTLVPFAMGVAVLAAGLGIGHLVAGFSGGASAAKPSRRMAGRFLLGSAAGTGAALWFLSVVTNTHNCFSIPGTRLAFVLAGILAGGTLSTRPFRAAPGFLFAGLGATLLVAYYGGIFDYYHAEAGFFGFAAAIVASRPNPGSEAPSASPQPSLPIWRRWQFPVVLALTIIGLWNMAGALKIKVGQDTSLAYIRLYEKALRNGSLPPSQIGFAPFGYVGWRLQDYQTDRGEVPTLGGFMDYDDAWDGVRGTSVITRLPQVLKWTPSLFPSHNSTKLKEHPEGRDLLTLKSRVFWNSTASFTLRQVEGEGRDPSQPVVNPALYREVRFPLSDAEWRELIRSGGFATSPRPATSN